MTKYFTKINNRVLTIAFIMACSSFIFGTWTNASNQVDRVLSQCSTSQISNNTVFTQIFTPTKPNFSGIYISDLGSISTTTWDIYLCQGTPNPATMLTDYDCSNNVFVASTTITKYSGSGQTFNFNTVPVEANTKHFIVFKKVSGSNVNFGVCSNYQGEGVINHTTAITYNSLSNFSSTLYDDEYVTFDEPLTGDSFGTGVENIFFVMSYLNPNDTYNGIHFELYNKETKELNKQNYAIISTSSVEYVSFLLSGLGDANYKATAYMYNTFVSSVTSSMARIDFKVGNNTVPNWGDTENLPTGVDYCIGLDTSGFFGAIQCGLKNVIYWAFKPSSQSQNYLNSGYNELKQSFPFSAFFQLTDTVKNGIASTTLSSSSTLDMVFVKQNNGQAEYYAMPILSSSSIAKTIGQTNSILVRNSLGWIMWLAVAWFIFLQFKKI